MIALYLRSLFQRGNPQQLNQFKPPPIPEQKFSAEVTPDSEHYQRYCEMVGWSSEKHTHPCYFQMRAMALQIQCLTAPNSPFPVMGLVHRANRIRQWRACQFEEAVRLTAYYRSVVPHARGWDIEVVVSGEQSGNTVYEASGIYLVRTPAPHVAPKVKGATHQSDAFADYSTVAEIDASQDLGRRYAAVSGDFNPIHLSRISAKMFGFKRAIAHGMWSLARCYSALDSAMSVAHRNVALDCEFRRPLFLPASCKLLRDKSQVALPLHFALTDSKRVTTHLVGSLSHFDR
ncbi:hypothetical protein DXV75_02470 [Alteromonas aestuariivivens]|uniref:MaoC-like domain-containing protein n=1 Tax=Alteromonas aestuariivivens TaxID=1938339 RepID=A0A3D8MEZ9_9ALTE|nr:MaoC/PaaZ C-terminal domain-containing protein [Alteromonas aestuariivivens]RDV29332.1 hypothetical protein DXV75_02470 [Alteromonas aestuariivivens]